MVTTGETWKFQWYLSSLYLSVHFLFLLSSIFLFFFLLTDQCFFASGIPHLHLLSVSPLPSLPPSPSPLLGHDKLDLMFCQNGLSLSLSLLNTLKHSACCFFLSAISLVALGLVEFSIHFLFFFTLSAHAVLKIISSCVLYFEVISPLIRLCVHPSLYSTLLLFFPSSCLLCSIPLLLFPVIYPPTTFPISFILCFHSIYAHFIIRKGNMTVLQFVLFISTSRVCVCLSPCCWCCHCLAGRPLNLQHTQLNS